MIFSLDLIDIIKILAVGVLLVTVLFTQKKKGYVYNTLDKIGIILNIVLSVIYIPMSLVGVFMVFLADNPAGMTEIQINLLYYSIFLGISVPFVSIGSIITSVVARKSGKSKFSFLIQFLPILIFIKAVVISVFVTTL